MDSSNNLYVGGHTEGIFDGGSNAGNYDVWFAKYDSSGARLWIEQFGSSGEDILKTMAVDLSSNLYIGGNTVGVLDGGSNAGNNDAWFAQYDSSGTRLWIVQFGTVNNDHLKGMAVDSSNNVYIGGQTYGTLTGSNAGSYDIWLAKYDSSGTQQWIVQFGSIYAD